jgi:long-chain acyl-CoA synthetase
MLSPQDDAGAFRSIADIPYAQARRLAAKPAVIHGDAVLTYEELRDRCGRFAAFVAARAGPGGRVALLLPNVPELAVGYFGAIAAGAVAVPVNQRLTPPEIAYVLSDCRPSVVVTTRAQHEKLAHLPEARCVEAWVLSDGEAPGALPFPAALADDPLPAPVATSPGDVACLLYTSGTTGFPKGAMISHANALFNAGSCRRALGYRPDDVGLVTLPLFHVTALHSQLVGLLACGATVVLQQDYDTQRMLELAERRGVTALFLVPAIYKVLTLRRDDVARRDLSRVRLAAYGGAPMDPETVRTIRELLPGIEMHNCYGLTECSSLGTVLPAAAVLEKADSVGLPVPGTEAEVRDEAGRPLPAGQAGELYLRGPHIVQGYFGAPEKTRDAIRDGWLRTGDIARIDDEGFVFILDRAKDMINRGGEKIYGLEVENVLYGFPGIAEAAVAGVPHVVFGEVPVAFVVPFPGARVDPEALRRHCASRLADFKVPVAVRFLERLPRNPGGKVVKLELRRAWEAQREEEGP